MTKRIKSFLITASSILGTAFLAVTITPEWANFVTFANDKLLGLGIPAVIVALVGVFISEAWKGFLNKRTLAKIELIGYSAYPLKDELASKLY